MKLHAALSWELNCIIIYYQTCKLIFSEMPAPGAEGAQIVDLLQTTRPFFWNVTGLQSAQELTKVKYMSPTYPWSACTQNSQLVSCLNPQARFSFILQRSCRMCAWCKLSYSRHNIWQFAFNLACFGLIRTPWAPYCHPPAQLVPIGASLVL